MRTLLKRFVPLLLVLTLVFTMSVSALAVEGEPLLSLNGPAEVLHDGKFSLTLDTSAKDVVADGKLVLHYDDGLEFLGGEAGAAWSKEADLSLQIHDNDNGKLILAFAGAVPADSGTLVTLHFATRGDQGKAAVTLDGESSYITGYEGTLSAQTQVDCVCYADDYPDVDLKRYYHEGVDYVVSKGYMIGMDDGLFMPEGETNRAMLVTILYRMAGAPAVTGKMPFTDVPENRYFYDAVVWAYQNDIARGMTTDSFGPNLSVTREQMVTFFARYAKYLGLNVDVKHDLSQFTDADEIMNFAKGPMQWAVANGIVDGMGNNTLEPGGTSTRGQIATIVVRFMALLED